jgi:hypothetical protein
MMQHIKNSDFGLCRHFNVGSYHLTSRLKSTDGALYKLNIELDILFLPELHYFPYPVAYCHV